MSMSVSYFSFFIFLSVSLLQSFIVQAYVPPSPRTQSPLNIPPPFSPFPPVLPFSPFTCPLIHYP